MLYFIASGNYIKIGHSSQPLNRLESFQTGNPKDCRMLLTLAVENAKQVEGLLHERLAFCHVKGEWFQTSLQQAFRHLVELMPQIVFSGQGELLLESPPRPLLNDHVENFKSWWLSHHNPNWDEHLHPLPYLWERYHKEFFAHQQHELNEPKPHLNFQSLKNELL